MQHCKIDFTLSCHFSRTTTCSLFSTSVCWPGITDDK